MKEQDQIKAIAELDGIKICTHDPSFWDRVGTEQDSDLYCRECKKFLHDMRAKPYLQSYDAIVPVIQRQPKHIIIGVATTVGYGADILCMSPSQLCEALLRATGKWIE